MTTIAYRDGVLAVDSMCGRGSTITPGAYHKLVRLPDGSVAAGCGAVPIINLIIGWIASGCPDEMPEMDENSSVVHLGNDGIVTEYCHLGASYTQGEFDAWGSGFEPALAAMWCGKSAEEAVKIACKVDKNSAEPIFTMRPEPIETPAPTKVEKAKSLIRHFGKLCSFQ